MRPVDLASRLNVLQIVAWTILALWVVPGRAHFLYDEAYFYHQAIEVARHAAFPVYGPPVSGSDPTAFTPGGSAYALLAVPFIVGTDPRLGAAWLIVLSSLAVWCLDRVLKAFGMDTASRVFTVAALTWSTWHVRLVDRIWNNHVEWPLAVFLLGLSLSLVARPASRSRLLMALFGLTAAVLVQAHLQGALAVAACLALILTEGRPYRRLGPWLPAVATCGALYAPYVVWEITHQFQNTVWMLGAGAVAHGNAGAVLRGAVAPVWFQSLFQFALVETRPLDVVMGGRTWSHWAQVVTSLLAIGVTAWFFFRRTALRRFVIVCWILSPVYFFVIRREYHDHYLYSLAPFFILPLGLALGDLFRRGRRWAVASACFMALWIGVHTTDWVPEYRAGLHRPTLVTQLRRAEAASKGSGTIQVQSNDPDVFIVWTLAKDHFGRELLFHVDNLPGMCRIAIGPRSPDTQVTTVSWDSYFKCPEPLRSPAG